MSNYLIDYNSRRQIKKMFFLYRFPVVFTEGLVYFFKSCVFPRFLMAKTSKISCLMDDNYLKVSSVFGTLNILLNLNKAILFLVYGNQSRKTKP